MAVILVILVLAAIGMGVAGYVQKKVAIASTKSQIAAIEAALETYKSDWGYYPPTSAGRISTEGRTEESNNAILYRALFAQGKRYLNFPSGQLLPVWRPGNVATNILDVYGKPFNYYCSPTTQPGMGSAAVGQLYGLLSGTLVEYYTAGGQVNVASYDLFSYGADKITFAGTNASFATATMNWRNPTNALDDITNWGP